MSLVVFGWCRVSGRCVWGGAKMRPRSCFVVTCCMHVYPRQLWPIIVLAPPRPITLHRPVLLSLPSSSSETPQSASSSSSRVPEHYNSRLFKQVLSYWHISFCSPCKSVSPYSSSSSQECPDIYYLLSVLSQDLPSSKVLFNHYHGPGLSLFPDLLV